MRVYISNYNIIFHWKSISLFVSKFTFEVGSELNIAFGAFAMYVRLD